ncbi:MAG: hypothetical protein ACP5GZ_08840 [Vulcanisaeta sp.]|jgi:7-cyano-7-deazaguanine reductase|uniref:hypothetical protein n=1 Tax=Vulcanisaeta TaxID=164450 RepID=UPI00064EC8FB|nr:hypothetical protein [Vulcanisaeta moutnovskia]
MSITIRAGPVDNVHIETTFSAICPVDHSVDNYNLEIDYKPLCRNNECIYIELNSLREYLDGFKGRIVYHEDLINELINELVKVLSPIEITVTLTSNYRGIKYVIRRSISTRGSQYAP